MKTTSTTHHQIKIFLSEIPIRSGKSFESSSRKVRNNSSPYSRHLNSQVSAARTTSCSTQRLWSQPLSHHFRQQPSVINCHVKLFAAISRLLYVTSMEPNFAPTIQNKTSTMNFPIQLPSHAPVPHQSSLWPNGLVDNISSSCIFHSFRGRNKRPYPSPLFNTFVR